MDAGVKSKVAIFVCFICFFHVKCVPLPDEEFRAIQDIDSFSKDTVKTTVKRSADWSKRISSLDVPAHIAEGSELVLVTSKAPRIIRRMRVHRKGENGVEVFKEFNPESRPTEGGNRIVRVKKLKRKLVRQPTTVAPETSTMTTTTSTAKPTSYNPKVTSSSPYSHITVINKEVRHQKKNKKKKMPKYNFAPTPPYIVDERHNDINRYTTATPNVEQFIAPKPLEHSFNTPNFFPDFETYFSQIQSTIPSGRQTDVYLGAQQFRQPLVMPKMNSNYKDLDFRVTRMTPQHLPPENPNKMDDLGYLSSSLLKLTSPTHILDDYRRQPRVDPPAKENLKESSTQVKLVRKNLRKPGTERPSRSINQTEVTEQNMELSLTTLPTVASEETNPNKDSNTTTSPKIPIPESKIPSKNPQIAAIPIGEAAMPEPTRFPSRYPSSLYGRQNAFADPFFDTPEIPALVPIISPWGHQFSPVFTGPQNRGLMLSGDVQPYQSRDVIPGFHHSPQLLSLRRSIMDYGDETTTSEPVTQYSLPKFELPPIDFNDKGCQTVYKEVKTVPGDRPRARNSNAKSFIMTRECFFPNGVPTTEPKKGDLSEASVEEIKDTAFDSKVIRGGTVNP